MPTDQDCSYLIIIKKNFKPALLAGLRRHADLAFFNSIRFLSIYGIHKTNCATSLMIAGLV